MTNGEEIPSVSKVLGVVLVCCRDILHLSFFRFFFFVLVRCSVVTQRETHKAKDPEDYIAMGRESKITCARQVCKAGVRCLALGNSRLRGGRWVTKRRSKKEKREEPQK
jgi:hypothetical protein